MVTREVLDLGDLCARVVLIDLGRIDVFIETRKRDVLGVDVVDVTG